MFQQAEQSTYEPNPVSIGLFFSSCLLIQLPHSINKSGLQRVRRSTQELALDVGLIDQVMTQTYPLVIVLNQPHGSLDVFIAVMRDQPFRHARTAQHLGVAGGM